MTNIYVINEVIKKEISALEDLMISTLGKASKEGSLSWSYRILSDLPKIIFSELENDPRLGYFSSEQNLIVMNTILLDDSVKEEREAVFLHELAHWVVYRIYGDYVSAHGEVFKEICNKIGVPSEFEKATVKIKDWQSKKTNAERKVKKLLALSGSPFEAESQSALSKAQSMMTQYSLSYLLEDDNRLFGLDLNTYKRIDSWKLTLGRIVADLSGCYKITIRTEKGAHISYFGSREQVESALYFQLYFEDALDKEYQKNRSRLHGITEKNTFLNGLCNALYHKTFTTGRTTSIIQSQEKSKTRYKEISGSRIYRTHSYATVGNGYFLGAHAGNKMTIPSRQTACKVRGIEYNK